MLGLLKVGALSEATREMEWTLLSKWSPRGGQWPVVGSLAYIQYGVHAATYRNRKKEKWKERKRGKKAVEKDKTTHASEPFHGAPNQKRRCRCRCKREVVAGAACLHIEVDALILGHSIYELLTTNSTPYQ